MIRLYPIRGKRKQNVSFLMFLVVATIFVILFSAIMTLRKPNMKIPFFPNLGMENIALKRVAKASSNLNLTSSATQAVDGSLGTVWESNHAIPASITVTLDHPFSLNQIVVKLPTSWGPRTEKIEVLGSPDNNFFVQISPPTTYSISPTAVININSAVYKYIRLVISSNSQTNSAQIAELEIYGTDPSLHWEIQSVDVMKYTKDVVCNPPSDEVIAAQVARAKELGANYVAISTPYDDLPCGSSLNLTTKWVNEIRAQGLHVWHRHTKSSWEGISGVPKRYNDDVLQTMSNYIINNPSLFAQGDIFTPIPEPDSAGISGVTSCFGVCQFKDISDFNQWIRNAQTIAKFSFAKIGYPDMKVGYYGMSGFIVFGENNPDWLGKTFLEQRTVDAMDGVIAIDIYPEFYGGSMSENLNTAHKVWPNATLVVGEWGTISIASDSAKVEAVINTMSGSEKDFVKGFNYWNLGPSANEGLLDGNFSPLPAFQTVKEFYAGFR